MTAGGIHRPVTGTPILTLEISMQSNRPKNLPIATTQIHYVNGYGVHLLEKRKKIPSLRPLINLKKTMKALNVIITMLLVVGGLNWGLVGLFEFDLVQSIFGQGAFSRIIYTIVGLSAIGKVILWNIEENKE